MANRIELFTYVEVVQAVVRIPNDLIGVQIEVSLTGKVCGH